MKRIINFLCWLTFPLLLWAQDFQYRLEGSYPLPQSSISNNGVTQVAFTLGWNEREGEILGSYQDKNFFGIIPLAGTASDTRRVFTVNSPNPVQGLTGLDIELEQGGLINGTTSLQAILKDGAGFATTPSTVIASMTSLPRDPELSCEIGFGNLAGYCGLYRGTITEEVDTAGRCDLAMTQDFRLELATNSKMNLYLTSSGNVVGLPAYDLGSIPPSPLSSYITQVNRNCGNLAATSFISTNCQTITLSGSFDTTADMKKFVGTLTMNDEANNDSCRYRLDLERALAY